MPALSSTMKEYLRDTGENDLVDRLISLITLSADVIVGPGDDCAVIEPAGDSGNLQLLKTDCIIEGVHFAPGTDPERVGWKAVCRVLSDIAAMGGSPEHALVTLAVDGDREIREIEGWYRGMQRASTEVGRFVLVGGETASLPQTGALISIAMTGSVPRDGFITRSGSRPGDWIAVTGRLGGSFESGRHLTFHPRLPEGRWLAALPPHLRPTAMMDISDGLSQDLPRLADASGVPGFDIDFEQVPVNEDSDLRSALGEGEDYELLFTVSSGAREELANRWKDAFPDTRLTFIGKMEEENERSILEGGWEHFRSGN